MLPPGPFQFRLQLPGPADLDLGILMNKAVVTELRFLKSRKATGIRVNETRKHNHHAETVVTSSLDGAVEVQRFVCWERNGRTPTKRIVYARPQTTIVVRVA